MVAVRRAGVLPGPPRLPVDGPGVDDRPVCVPAAAERWHHVVSSWPVLEDEWMLTVISNGWRVPADLVPELLTRHRTDPIRRARAELACGPLAGWLVGHLPELAARGATGAHPDPSADEIAELPPLPIPPDLEPLLDAEGDVVAAQLAGAIDAGAAGPRSPSRSVQPRRTHATRLPQPGGIGARSDRRWVARVPARLGARRPRPNSPAHARRVVGQLKARMVSGRGRRSDGLARANDGSSRRLDPAARSACRERPAPRCRTGQLVDEVLGDETDARGTHDRVMTTVATSDLDDRDLPVIGCHLWTVRSRFVVDAE